LTFLNSWGPDWGDHGKFRIGSGAALGHLARPGTRFYDVYFLESDLTEEEKAAWREYSRQTAASKIGVFDELIQCPHCAKQGRGPRRAAEFFGHVLVAECPVCSAHFVPESHLAIALYCRPCTRPN
jgi:hypothetical protein